MYIRGFTIPIQDVKAGQLFVTPQTFAIKIKGLERINGGWILELVEVYGASTKMFIKHNEDCMIIEIEDK